MISSRSARLINSPEEVIIMTRLLQVALLTTGISLVHTASASAQMSLPFGAPILPPAMVEELKRFGIDLPPDRVKASLHIQQSANGFEVRFSRGVGMSEPKQAVRNEGQEPAATAAAPTPAPSLTPPKTAEPASTQARSEEQVARPAEFDGTWNVSLTANGGFLCERVKSMTFTAQNGSVRGSGSGVSVSGQIGSSGSVSMDFQGMGVQGSGSGKLTAASGSGAWKVPAIGCSGSWTAQRQATVTAQAN
jgi:hypothetical protein